MTQGPPGDVSPEVLFRLLVARPRPRRRIPWRSPAAPHVALHVQGLCALEVASVIDALEGVEPSLVRESRATCGIVAKALVLSDGNPAFRDGEQLARLLDDRESSALADDVARALAVISPFYATIDVGAWQRALVAGARTPRNLNAAVALGRCVDIAYGAKCREATPRPERYFGGAQADLTDGQWLAFRAARAVVVAMENT